MKRRERVSFGDALKGGLKSTLSGTGTSGMSNWKAAQRERDKRIAEAGHFSYEHLTELILAAQGNYVRIVTHADGSAENIYRGASSDLVAFLNRNDGRRHEHWVYRDNELVYHRDVNGKVTIGATDQLKKSAREKSLGRQARRGFFR